LTFFTNIWVKLLVAHYNKTQLVEVNF